MGNSGVSLSIANFSVIVRKMIEKESASIWNQEPALLDLLRQAPIPFCLCQISGDLLFANQAFSDLVSASPSTLIQLPVWQWLGLANSDYWTQLLSALDEQALVGTETSLMPVQGGVRDVRWTISWADSEQKQRAGLIQIWGTNWTREREISIQLEHELASRAKEIQLLGETASQIALGLDLPSTMRDIVSSVKRLIHCHGVTIFLLDEGKKTMRVQAVQYDPGVYPDEDLERIVETMVVTVGEGLSGWVAATGQPVIAPDAENDPRVVHIPGTLHVEESLLVVPLKLKEETKGVITLSRLGLHQFNARDLALVEALASQATVAIENAQVFLEEQRKTERIAFGRELYQALSLSLDAEEVLRTFLRVAVPRLCFDWAGFLFYDRQSNNLRSLATPEDPAVAFPFNGSLAEELATSGTISFCDRIASSPTYGEEQWLRDKYMDAYCAIPLISKGDFRGLCLMAYRNPPVSWAREEIEDLAYPLSAAMENARLYTNAKIQLEMLALVSRTGVAIAGGEADLRQTLKRVLEETRSSIGSHSVRLYQLEPDQATLRPEIVVYEPGHYSISDEELLSKLTLHLGEGITGWVTATGQGVITGDAEHDPRVKHVEGTPFVDESMICLPLLLGERILGALTLSKLGLNQFGEQEYLLASSLASQIAVATENARLYQDQLMARERLEQDIEQIRQLESMREDFLYSVSHELKTPLVTISAVLEMAARNPEQERAGVFLRYYPVLQRSSERLDRLVANLLETSKISSGASDVKAQREDLKVLLVEVREHLLPEAALKGIDMVLDIGEGPTDLYFDREKTRIVLVNLLSNAIRFSPVGGQILVGCMEEADDVQISVLDNGPGIARADLPHIFDRFFRSSSRLIRNTSGTGMGLYLSKALVEMQGGHIAILSEPGKGTNVTFSLPRNRA